MEALSTPGERFVAVALFGGLDLDLTSAPPELEVTIVAIFGGARVRVRSDQEVIFDGFSLFGGRRIDPRFQESVSRRSESPAADSDEDRRALPLEIFADSRFGGVKVKRA